MEYAAEEDSCIEFIYTLTPLSDGPLTPELATELTTSFNTAVNTDGALYDALVSEYPDTEIVGVGSPGKSALVLFYLMNSCVQYEVFEI